MVTGLWSIRFNPKKIQMFLTHINRLHIGLIWVTVVYLSYKIHTDHHVKPVNRKHLQFKSEVTRTDLFTSIAKDNLIILSTTDYHYLDLALNLHQSIVKFNISNYIFGCTDLKACAELKRRNIQWVYFKSVHRGSLYDVTSCLAVWSHVTSRVSVPGLLFLPRGLCPGGVCVQGCLCRGVCWQIPLESEKRAVRILLEYFLVKLSLLSL